MTSGQLPRWRPIVVAVAVLELVAGAALAAAELDFAVPNPFFDQRGRNQQDAAHDDFYLIRVTEAHTKGYGAFKEYFSLGRALSFRAGLGDGMYILLTDGRSGKTYLVRESSENHDPGQLECELDSTHSNKHMFPWQFVYDVRARETGGSGESSAASNSPIVAPPVGLMPQLDEQVAKNTTRRNKARRNKRRLKATIFGLGAVWLNMIKADVRSTEIDDGSHYRDFNSWSLKTEHVDLELLFRKGTHKEGEQPDQATINKLQPAKMHVNTLFRFSPSSPERHQFSLYDIREFKQNVRPEDDETLQWLMRQLEYCKLRTSSHRIFPNLMRAMATSGDRAYRIEYVAKRFNLLGDQELNGEYNERHHRHMWPQELVSEVFSFKYDVQSLLYDPNFLESQKTDVDGRGDRLDMFMSCFTEGAEGRSARHAAQYYHRIVHAEGDEQHNCVKGEREPKPRFRMLSKAIKFHTKREIEYEGHLHGLGALLLHALEMRRSSNLLPLSIQVPLDFHAEDKRKASVNVWQVVDEREQIRVLFFIERRDPKVERRELDQAKRDRNELARLVRVDIRTLDESLVDFGSEDEEGSRLKVTQQLIDNDSDLLIQYHVFEFVFELEEFERQVYLDVPDDCKRGRQADGNPPDVEEDDDDMGDAANNYDKSYEGDDDDEDQADDKQADANDREAEFQFESDLVEEATPLPDLTEMLTDATSYKITSRLEILPDDGPTKSIWLVETMDLAAERLDLRVFTSSRDLERDQPSQEYFILYQAEVIFEISKSADNGLRRCVRRDEVMTGWLHLLSAHLTYYVVQDRSESKRGELDANDLVDETNSLSSYGLGALWRRASQLGLTEYLGVKRERLVVLNEDGAEHQYKQLVWIYEELDMTFEWTFILKDDPAAGEPDQHHIGTDLRLHSVLIQNKHSSAAGGLGERLSKFKPVLITVESFEMGGDKLSDQLSRVPGECTDVLIEANRMTELDHEINPPGYEAVLGTKVQGYELEYSIFTNKNMPTNREEQLRLAPPRGRTEAALSYVPVREWFNMATGQGQIVIYENDPNKALEIYIDNNRKVLLAYSRLINKCSRLTHLAPTYGTLLSVMVLDNEHFDADKLHGLMGLWQALSQKPARLHRQRMVLPAGDRFEEQVYTVDAVDPTPDGGRSTGRREEIKLHFEKGQPYRSGSDRVPAITRDKVRIRVKDVLSLRVVEFKSVNSKTTKLAREPFSKVFINRLVGEAPDKWEPPHACRQLLSKLDPADSDSEPESIDAERPAAGEFPKLSELFWRSRRFEMRSETSIRGGLGGTLIVDELYNEGDFRLRSRGLDGAGDEQNCDLLMLANTRDQFDLSEPLRCPQLRSEPPTTSKCLSPNLYEIWLGAAQPGDLADLKRIKSLASLHYGPLTLWRLAEQISTQMPDRLELIKTIEMSKSSKWEPVEQFRQRLERQMNRELWRVASDSANPSRWSYVLEFIKYSRSVDNVEVEWHMLDSISMMDSQETNDDQFSVFVEVVKYNWLPDQLQFEPWFRLPEGWNCKRKCLAQDEISRPHFAMSSKRNKQLTYETTLELFEETKIQFGLDDLEAGPRPTESYTERKLLSSQIGAFLTSGDLDGLMPARWQDEHSELPKQPAPRFDMDLHQSVSRVAAGEESLASHMVIDRRGNILYDLDMKTGACKIGPAPRTSWELPLPDSGADEPDSLKLANDVRRLDERDLFTKMFLDDEDDAGNRLFHLLNERTETITTPDGTASFKLVHTTYEYEYPMLSLTSRLSGPARVVREFSRVELGGARDDNLRAVSARVYLLNQDKTRLRALLRAQVQEVRQTSLSEFLNMAQLADCFNQGEPLSDRRKTSLTLEYPMLDQTDQLMARMSIDTIREQFYALLLAQNRLWPTQLDGKARFEFTGHDNLLRVHFNVLEAPTSSVYFQTQHHCTFTDQLISLAETRVLPNQLACSRWCDQINCVAMSYCDDHQCHLLSSNSYQNYDDSTRNQRTKSSLARRPGSLLQALSLCSPVDTCTYSYNHQQVRQRPLSAFRDFLDRTVNRRINKQALKELSLPLGDSQRFLEPSRFYASSEMFRWQHEDFSDPFEEVLSSSVDMLAIIPGSNHTLASFVGGADQTELASTFAVWRARAQFSLDTSKLDKLNERLNLGQESKFLIMWSVAFTGVSCLQQCQRSSCLLVASCKHSNRCQMIVATGSESALKLDQLDEIVDTGESSQDCTISIRDHLEEFHLFEGTQRPVKFSHQLDHYTRDECAVACHQLGSRCLAFDLCASSHPVDGAERDRSNVDQACFLQETHVSQDAFDRSALLPAWDRDSTSEEAHSRNTINGALATCDHYSKSVLAGFFQRIPNMKLKELHQSVLLGVSADKCAADCLQDDACRGFEHCQNPRSTPTQSCYPIRRLEGDTAAAAAAAAAPLRDQLKVSRVCSVYVPKATLSSLRSEQILTTISFDSHGSAQSGGWLSQLVVYLLLTVVVGAIVQLAYVKLGGSRPIQFHADRW